MAEQEFDLESLLSDILDDSKPLPTGATPAPTPMEVAQAADVQSEMALADADPEDVLAGILNGDAPPTVTQSVTEIKEDLAARIDEDTATEDTIANALSEAADAMGVPAGIFTDTADREEGAEITPLKMPTFAPADFASTIDIRNFATLVTLNTARWHAKVKDRQAGKDAATANDADQGAFEVRKKLLAGNDALLKAIHKAIDEARASHYDMTLPWSTTSMNDVGRRTGGRLLPNTLFVEYTTVMAQKKQQMLDALNKFEPKYAELVEASRKQLGKRFDAREYPNVSSIRGHFDLSFDFQPIPKGDDFKGLPRAQLDALARKINDNTQQMAENAMQEVWMRLHEVVSKMAERLGSPDKVFHDSLVQNVRDTARLLAHLNVTDDVKVEALRKKVERHLCAHDPKELRSNAVTRTTVAAHAKSIIEEMNK